MQHTRSKNTRVWVGVGLILGLAWTLGTQVSSGQQQQKMPDMADLRIAKNFQLVGHTMVENRPMFKLAIQEVKGRWYLYGGAAYHNGWSVTDVTDPTAPKFANWIPGPANTSTVQLDFAEGVMITPLSRPLVNRGRSYWDPITPNPQGGFYIWDSTEPVNPKRLGQFKAQGTHRNYYDANTKYLHASVSMEGYSGMIYMIIDLSNPANPVEVSRWWLPGQWTAGGEKWAKGETPGGQHGPPQPVGNLVYLSYGAAGAIVLDISDVKKPKMIGRYKTTPPFTGGIPTHTVFPIPDRKIAIISSEAGGEGCPEGPLLDGILDISNPRDLRMLSYLPEPKPAPGLPYATYCEGMGRFGPHNVPQHPEAKAAQKQGDILYQTWFSGGLRAYDISNPSIPEEVGYFVPQPTRRIGPLPFNTLSTYFEDVLVDRRGYVYITDRNSGIWIVKYTGPNAPAVAE